MTDAQVRPFRWALFGTGAVSRKFALDIKAADMDLACVASRNPDKAARFARDLGVTEAASDYAAALKADVDAVYVATPAALHEEHARMAIAAGKPVLVEKPMATDAASAARIAEAAQKAGVFAMEALWTRFQPLPNLVQSRIAAGDLGEIRGFEARFMAPNIPDAGVSLFDPVRGGGALLHRGIYPLSMAQFLLGPIAETQTMARIGETGVDEDSVLTLRHSSDAISTIRAGLRTAGPDQSVVYGTKGTLYIHGPIWRPTKAVLHRIHPAPVTQGGKRRLEAFRESRAGLRMSGVLQQIKGVTGRRAQVLKVPFEGNGYRYEALAVRDAVRTGQMTEPRMTPADSIDVLRVIDTARAAWGVA